jgi:hypothetical protein
MRSFHRLGESPRSSDALIVVWKLQGLRLLPNIGKAKSLGLQFKHPVQSLSQSLLFSLDFGLLNAVRIQGKLLLAIEDRLFKKHDEFLNPLSVVRCT